MGNVPFNRLQFPPDTVNDPEKVCEAKGLIEDIEFFFSSRKSDLNIKQAHAKVLKLHKLLGAQ